MANIPGILSGVSAALLLGSAFLAYKNNEALETEVADREAAERQFTSAQENLARLREEVTRTQEQITTARDEAKVLVSQSEEQRAKIDAMRSDVMAKRQEEETLRAKVDAIQNEVENPAEVRQMAEKIQRLNQELAQLEDDKKAKEATRANLLAEKESIATRIARYNDINERVRRPESYFSSTRISGVYPEWGFVTLAAGSTSGVVAGSMLNVLRDGEIIAKLRVRSVESGRAAADVVPDSKAEDVTLSVGDRVEPAAGGAVPTAQASN